MKIAIRNLELNPKIRFKNLFNRIHLRRIPADTAEFNSGKTVFKHIKLKTAQKMYNTAFTPSNADYGENVYKTFVLSKTTGEPVEVLVLPKKINKYEEEYYILDPRRISKDMISVRVNVQTGMVIPVRVDDNLRMNVIGERGFSCSPYSKEITSGTMSSKGNSEYSGLGLTEHQIAIERMLMKKCDELTIFSIPHAYQFHKNCGFEVVKSNIYLNPREFQGKIEEYSRRLNLDEDTVKNMLIYRQKSNGDYLLDENSSFEKIIKYLSDNNIPLGKYSYFGVPMQLTKGALKEWKKIIRKNPILIGHKLPEKVIS